VNIVFFAHPSFLGHQSMPRFAQMLAEGMRARGHTVDVWAPEAKLSRWPAPKSLKKWLGYADQYIFFPAAVRRRLRSYPADTLFSFTDQALGPWVPLLEGRPRVVHCHDFLAQRSMLGEIPENPPGWTGQQYQAFIRRGYARGQHFISVSRRTQEDLHRFLPQPPASSAVVYNGMNQRIAPQEPQAARHQLSQQTGLALAAGYLLHVGGNHFYKNRVGVIEIYEAWRATGAAPLPLLLIGEAPNESLLAAFEKSPYKADIHLLTGCADETVRTAYAGASVFLFPSLAEGFGWPIAEAMAAGCPVITTNEAPMTEVAGEAGFLVPRRPSEPHEVKDWAANVAQVVAQILGLSAAERQAVVAQGLLNAKRFNTDTALDKIEEIYSTILAAKS
jgi:glycosyltransferase involved in cell wall biosynthesis